MGHFGLAIKAATVTALLIFIIGGIHLAEQAGISLADVQAAFDRMSMSLGAVALFVAVAIFLIVAVLSPFIFAARSGDGIAVLVSIGCIGLSAAVLISSRTIMDMLLAAMIYGIGALISVIVFATNSIIRALGDGDQMRRDNARFHNE